MGMTGVQENGHGEMGMSDFPLGSKNKYKRMDSVFTDDDDQYQLEKRKKSTRKYVFGCAVFASLNNVLLGYGKSYYSFYMSVVLCFMNYEIKVLGVYVY